MAKRRNPRQLLKGRRNLHGFSASLMSDTKWRKLFVALDRPDLSIRQVRLKFRDVEHSKTLQMPTRASLACPRAFIDLDEYGPTPLRSIEWIEFPAAAEYTRPSPDGRGRVPSKFVKQDIEQIEAILAVVGQFPMERNGDALRINGHVRGKSRRC
jgi:hypothetical protein